MSCTRREHFRKKPSYKTLAVGSCLSCRCVSTVQRIKACFHYGCALRGVALRGERRRGPNANHRTISTGDKRQSQKRSHGGWGGTAAPKFVLCSPPPQKKIKNKNKPECGLKPQTRNPIFFATEQHCYVVWCRS